MEQRFFSGKKRKSFIGTVQEDSFEIVSSDIQDGNSFRAVIKGRISDVEDGCTIHVTMHLHEFVSTFMMVWLSMVFIFFIISTGDLLSGGSFSFGRLVPLLMLTFGYGMLRFGFRYGAKKSKKRLFKVLGISHRLDNNFFRV